MGVEGSPNSECIFVLMIMANCGRNSRFYFILSSCLDIGRIKHSHDIRDAVDR